MSERGSGWEMHHGDCLEVMQSLGEVDHVITDPPYEAEAHTKQRRALRDAVCVVEALNFEPITERHRSIASQFMAHLVRRWVVVFCQVEAASRWSAALCPPLEYIRTCVWIKPDGQPQYTGDRPGMGYESLVVAHPRGRKRWNGGGRVGVFSHNKNDPAGRDGARAAHPTTKPLPLMLELVSLFTDPGETVLDPFAGSGTTGVAALRLGRMFVGIERDEKYFRLACDRLRAEEQGSTLQAHRAGQLPLLK